MVNNLHFKSHNKHKKMWIYHKKLKIKKQKNIII